MNEPIRRTTYEAFGIECGGGWAGLYEPLIELCKTRGIPILQIKEKFGGLRFYTGQVSDLDDIIRAAESASYCTCEDCGEHKVISHNAEGQAVYSTTTEASETSYWIRTLCEPCRKKWDDSRRKCNV